MRAPAALARVISAAFSVGWHLHLQYQGRGGAEQCVLDLGVESGEIGAGADGDGIVASGIDSNGRAAGAGGGDLDTIQVDPGSTQQDQCAVSQSVMADRSDHGDRRTIARGGYGLIGPFAAWLDSRGWSQDGLSGAGDTGQVEDQIEVDGAEDDDHSRASGRRQVEHEAGCAGGRAQPALGIDHPSLGDGGAVAAVDDLSLSGEFA